MKILYVCFAVTLICYSCTEDKQRKLGAEVEKKIIMADTTGRDTTPVQDTMPTKVPQSKDTENVVKPGGKHKMPVLKPDTSQPKSK